MPLKYDNEVVVRKKCDLTPFTEGERPAFCWCFAPINDAKNFTPRAISVGRDNCESWALSFFETQKQAEDRLARITDGKSNLFKFLGNHVAEGVLDKNDGISGNSDKDGHYNLHEYQEADLQGKFIIVKKVA